MEEKHEFDFDEILKEFKNSKKFASEVNNQPH